VIKLRKGIANHLQLHYFNGVLYGTATHFGYDPETHTFEIVPGPVYTLTFTVEPY